MKLKRPLFGPDNPRGPSRGRDVRDFVKRTLHRLPFQMPVGDNFFPKPPGGFDDVYNAKTVEAIKVLQRMEGIVPISGSFGQATLDLLWPYADAYSRWVYRLYKPPAPAPKMVSPISVGSMPTYLHPTAGLLGNWALDWMCPGGTPVYAAEDAKIKKLSGRDPGAGADQVVGIFGWSIHYETSTGYRYFGTHLGARENLIVGQSVKAGEKLGEVGRWPDDPGRSHLHLGVTSPLGESDAKRRINAVASAPRLA